MSSNGLPGVSVELNDVYFDYRSSRWRRTRQKTVLISFNLACQASTITAVLGPSGCGKSTILDLIAGLRSPSAGAVIISRDGSPARPTIGFIFQNDNCLPWLTVQENLLFGPRVTKGNLDLALSRAGLQELRDRYPSELSGGQQQRVAIGRLLVHRPDLVLCDEPWSSLDIGSRRQMESEVRALIREVGATGILVTHEPAEAIRVADVVLVLGGAPLRVLQRIDIREMDRTDPTTLETLTRTYLELLSGHLDSRAAVASAS